MLSVFPLHQDNRVLKGARRAWPTPPHTLQQHEAAGGAPILTELSLLEIQLALNGGKAGSRVFGSRCSSSAKKEEFSIWQQIKPAEVLGSHQKASHQHHLRGGWRPGQAALPSLSTQPRQLCLCCARPGGGTVQEDETNTRRAQQALQWAAAVQKKKKKPAQKTLTRDNQ